MCIGIPIGNRGMAVLRRLLGLSVENRPPPQQRTTMPSGLQQALRSAPVVVLASLGEEPDTRTESACVPLPARRGQNKIASTYAPGNTYSAASAGAASSRALSTLGGDMGWSRSLTPTASWMALEIAARGGMIGTSPIPRTP